MDKSLTLPTLSVVMSVYNGERYLKEAIESILNQTFKNFELIIINDGSSDSSQKIIESYKDARIKLINQKNKGLVASLNLGITQASGAFIARHDADDASVPARFEKQFTYLVEHPKTVIIGSSMQVMDEKSNILHTHHVLLGNAELKQELLVRSPFAHGSVMFRKDAALGAGLYSKDAWPAEDYEFWVRLSKEGDFANINEPLYTYRENTLGISSQNHTLQQSKTIAAQELAWKSRKSLVKNFKSNVRTYKSLDDGAVRIKRIYDNLAFAHRKAIKRRQLLFAMQFTPYLAEKKIRQNIGAIKQRVNKHA